MALLAYDEMEDLWRDFEQQVSSLSEAVDWWTELGEHDTDEVEEVVDALLKRGTALLESATKMSASLREAVTRIDND